MYLREVPFFSVDCPLSRYNCSIDLLASTISNGVSTMSNTSAPKKYVGSQGPDDCGTYQESAITPGQRPCEDLRSYSKRRPPPSDPYDRDEGYPQIYDSRAQGQSRSSMTAREDGGRHFTRKEHEIHGPENDRIRYDDRVERGANMGLGGSSRHGRDGYNGRSRPNEGM